MRLAEIVDAVDEVVVWIRPRVGGGVAVLVGGGGSVASPGVRLDLGVPQIPGDNCCKALPVTCLPAIKPSWGSGMEIHHHVTDHC